MKKKTSTRHRPGNWRPKASLRIPRSHPATAVYRNKVYVFGGGGPAFKSLDTVEVYDTKKDCWLRATAMPTLRSGAMAVTVDDKIYVIGGGFKKPDGKFRFLRTVEIYDPHRDSWEAGPEMIMPHDYPAVALMDGYIYILGGHHPEATEGGPQTDPGFAFCERLNLKTGEWEEVSPLPTPRFALSAITHGSRIWTLGGVAFTPEGFTEFDCVETYDPVLRVWSRSAGRVLPWSSAAHGSGVFQNRLYLFGGFSGTGGIGTQAAAYDFKSHRWSVIPPLPVARAAMGVAVVDHTIYLIGGWMPDRSVMKSVDAYRPLPRN